MFLISLRMLQTKIKHQDIRNNNLGQNENSKKSIRCKVGHIY